MEGFSGWIIVLIIAIGVLWEWTNRNFKMHERVINKLELELDRVRNHADLESPEMAKAQEVHEKTLNKIRREKEEFNKWIEEDKRRQEIIESREAELIDLNEELVIFLNKALNDLAKPLNVFKEFLDRKEEFEYQDSFDALTKTGYELEVWEKDKAKQLNILYIGAEREMFSESKINLIIQTYQQDLTEHPENNIFSEETHNNIDDALEELFNLL